MIESIKEPEQTIKSPLEDILLEAKEISNADGCTLYSLGDDGLLHPFVPFETFGDPKTLNCDRDSQGDVWFADMGTSVVRPRCLENLSAGLLPQKWMGQKICPIKQWGGCDVDYEWQIPMVEFWLKKHGMNK